MDETAFEEIRQPNVERAFAEVFSRALAAAGLSHLEAASSHTEAEVDLAAQRVTMLVEIELRPRRGCSCLLGLIPLSGTN